MPRKRRKSIASSVTPDIPYPKVRVEWIDCVSDSGWANEKEFDKMSLARPINEGWLYSKDKKKDSKLEFLFALKFLNSFIKIKLSIFFIIYFFCKLG